MITAAIPKRERKSKSWTVNRIAHQLLLGSIAVAYSGAVEFLALVSPYLLYGFYIVVIFACTIALFKKRTELQRLRSITPYLVWIVFYFVWGFCFSPNQDLVFGDTLRYFLRNWIFLVAVVIALADLRDLKTLSLLFQIIVFLNFLICVWETFNPSLSLTLARIDPSVLSSLDPNKFQIELRPGGLWINPNLAGFASVLAMLMSYWVNSTLFAWIGRLAAVGVIVLAASRTGLFLVSLGSLFYVIYWVVSAKRIARRLSRVTILGASLLLIVVLVNSFTSTYDTESSISWKLSRMLDFQERANYKQGQVSRMEITTEAAPYAWDGPWHGYGIFSFSGNSDVSALSNLRQGAHDIYLVVLGEVGILGGVLYLVVLGFGLRRIFRARLPKTDLLITFLIWLIYLIIGFTWHNQFTGFFGVVYAALLYHLPQLLGTKLIEESKVPVPMLIKSKNLVISQY